MEGQISVSLSFQHSVIMRLSHFTIRIVLITSFNFLYFFSYTQNVEDKIKHIVHSNRLLYRSSDYLKNAKVHLEFRSNFYQKIYPRYGEYFQIYLVKLDSMKIGAFDMYEYSILERCYSSRDSSTNSFLKSDTKLHFMDGDFKLCRCCNTTGDGFSESIPGLSDCKNTKGIISVHYPYNTNDPVVYFISGNCVILDQFEKLLFANQLINDKSLESFFQLKFWNSDIRKQGSRMSKLIRIRKNKFRILLKDSEKSLIIRLKRDKSFENIN